MTSTTPPGRGGAVLRWTLLVLAVLVGSTLFSTLLLLRCAPDTPEQAIAAATPPDTLGSDSDSTGRVSAEMRAVNYYVDPEIVLHIRSMTGYLVSTRTGEPAVFEDGASYRMHISSANIFIDTTSLSLLINRYVFGYRGAPIRDLHVSVDGEELIQKGKLGNVSFTIRSQVSLTPSGEIRLHPTDVKVLGINADGLMHKLGIELDEMVKVQPDRGIRIEENDFLLDVARILPPPRIQGKLSRVSLVPGGMVQVFGRGDSVPARTAFGDSMPATNFMYYHGGSIRFGKLMMTGTDLMIVDADPTDPFGFYLGRYHDQLVAGTHRTTPEDGLVVRMPDLGDLNGRNH